MRSRATVRVAVATALLLGALAGLWAIAVHAEPDPILRIGLDRIDGPGKYVHSAELSESGDSVVP